LAHGFQGGAQFPNPARKDMQKTLRIAGMKGTQETGIPLRFIVLVYFLYFYVVFLVILFHECLAQWT
jgi:hypothetical protein